MIGGMSTATQRAPSTSLTQAQIAAWKRDGFVAVPGFFDERETRALQAEVRRLQSAGKLRNVATIGDGRTTSTTAFNMQLCPAAPHSPLIRALPFSPKVVGAVTALLGDEVLLYLDQIFLKPGRHGVGTNWHTDNAYFQSRESTAGTGMWIAIHDANRANGTMCVIPRSHALDLAHERDPGSDHHITCAKAVDPADEVAIELPAGGVLFFNWGIAHRTGGNATDRERAALAYHFIDERHKPDNWSTSYVGGTAPPVLAGHGASGAAREWGSDQNGEFDRLVAEQDAGAV
jgi:phytanoyl-CoA hydroxylase